MKKIGLLAIGVIAALVLFSNLMPMVSLAVSVVVLYFVFKEFLKTDSTAWKIILGIFGFFLLLTAVANIPAVLGLVAIYVLYLVYKKWKEMKATQVYEKDDPFQNFEKQWQELNKYKI